MDGLGRIWLLILLLGREMGSMLGDWGFVRGLIVGFMRLSYEEFLGGCCDGNDYLWVYLYILFLTPLIYYNKNNNARIITKSTPTPSPKLTNLHPNNIHPNRNNRPKLIHIHQQIHRTNAYFTCTSLVQVSGYTCAG